MPESNPTLFAIFFFFSINCGYIYVYNCIASFIVNAYTHTLVKTMFECSCFKEQWQQAAPPPLLYHITPSSSSFCLSLAFYRQAGQSPPPPEPPPSSGSILADCLCTFPWLSTFLLEQELEK
jgi:hypothetical protein